MANTRVACAPRILRPTRPPLQHHFFEFFGGNSKELRIAEGYPLNIDFPGSTVVGADAQHSSTLVKDHVADDGIRKSVAEVSPFRPGVLALIHAVVGRSKNPPLVFRIDDDGINWNVRQVAGAIAPSLATVSRSKDMTSSKGRATCPYNPFRSSKDNSVADKFAPRTR